MRREFSKRVRLVIIERAMNAHGEVVCEGCGLMLGKKPYEIDHTIAEALVVDKTRSLTADDGKLLGVACCHRGGSNKTASDKGRIAKAKRQSVRHIGAHRSRRPMPGGRGSKWKKRMDGSVERR